MKQESKNPHPVIDLKTQLPFFYGILTLWESNASPKIIKDFRSSELKQLLARKDKNGHMILTVCKDISEFRAENLSTIWFPNSKGSYGMSLLYHLRNAFAHNDIEVEENGRIIVIEHIWNGKLKLKARIAFDVLKELIETLRGLHNLQKKENHKKKSK